MQNYCYSQELLSNYNYYIPYYSNSLQLFPIRNNNDFFIQNQYLQYNKQCSIDQKQNNYENQNNYEKQILNNQLQLQTYIMKITWTNQVHDPNIVYTLAKFFYNQDDIFMPLNFININYIIDEMNNYGFSASDIYSIRDTVSIHKAEDLNKKNICYDNTHFIPLKEKFEKYYSLLCSKIKNRQKQYNYQNDLMFDYKFLKDEIIKFCKIINYPIDSILKIMNNNNNIEDENDSIIFTFVKEIIEKLSEEIIKEKQQIYSKSKQYEEQMEKYFRSIGIKFKTETELRNQYNSSDKSQPLITPDFLLEKPIIIIVDSVEYEINWIEVKNFLGMNFNPLYRSMIAQRDKYTKRYGKGAIIFSSSFEGNLRLKDTLLLDGRFMKIK